MNIEKLAIEHGITITPNGYAGETDLLNVETAEAFAKALQSSEPVAWFDDYSDVITDKRKKFLLENGCGDDYHIPLFTHPPASVPLEKYNKLLDALKLAKVTFIANKMDVRNVMEVINEAIAEAEGKEG